MIFMGLLLLIIGIFWERRIMWPIAAVLVVIGVLVMLLSSSPYSYY